LDKKKFVMIASAKNLFFDYAPAPEKCKKFFVLCEKYFLRAVFQE